MSTLSRVYNWIKNILSSIWANFKNLNRNKKIILAVFFVIAIIAAVKLAPKAKTVEAPVTQNKLVSLASVRDLSSGNTSIPLVGNVTSVSEATILSEGSGRLTKVYKKLGDKVMAGQVIAEIENSGERAALLQAEGSYEAAKARRDIDNINSVTTANTSADVKTNVLNTINSTYTTIEDIILSKTDALYTNPRFDSVKVKMIVSDAALVNRIEANRIKIESMLKTRSELNSSLTINSDLLVELTKLEDEVRVYKNYLDDLADAYIKAIPSSNFSSQDIETQKQIVSGSRTALAGILTNLTASEVTLKNNLAAQQIAVQNGSSISPQASGADAQVKIALGNYNAALSRLEKTIIRSPISGTLNSLTIETGDFITPGKQVAVVSNNGALEILSYISESDVARVRAGTEVKINGDIKGVISRVASAIDPTTKKIEVRIGLVDNNSKLINGQSVRVDITGGNATSTSPSINYIKVPLSAVKITPRGANVFMVVENKIKSIEVKTGTLLGQEVQIVSGLNPEDIIVKDSRGLKEGETVEVNN